MRLSTVPFGLLAFVAYALIAVFAEDAAPSIENDAQSQALWALSVLELALISGRTVVVTVADSVIVLSVLAAIASVLIALWSGGRSLLANMISVLVLGAITMAFLVIPAAGTAVFLILAITYFLETVAVIAVSMRLKPRS